MDVSDKVLMLVHKNYEMSWIVRKLYSVETRNSSQFSVPDDSWSNQRKNKTNELKCTNSKLLKIK